MAKIRGIKPDFWTDDEIVELSAHARLLYVGLWNYACDNGHLEDRPRQIKMRILPADDVNVDELLDELTTGGRVARRDGWITIPNLGEHQRIDKRYFTTCKKPGCARPGEAAPQKPAANKAPHDGDTTGTRRGHSAPTSRPRVDGDGDGDGDGDMKRAASGDDARPEPPLEQTVTNAAYEKVGKAFNFIAVRQIVKWALNDRAAPPRQVHDAVVAVYEMGKPITKQTIGQYLDGHLNRSGNNRPLDRQAEVLRREIQAAKEADLMEIEQ